MVDVLALKSRQRTFCHSLICAHHFVRAAALVLRPRDFHSFRISSKIWPTSPMIGISVLITLFIEDGSISICALSEPGLNASKRPVIRSSKRAPILIIKSQSCMARLASYRPCMPNMPSQFSPEAGYAPSPIRVEVIGNPLAATNSRSKVLAAGPELMTPPPE